MTVEELKKYVTSNKRICPMPMSKYDYHNNKFLEHYACTAVYAYID